MYSTETIQRAVQLLLQRMRLELLLSGSSGSGEPTVLLSVSLGLLLQRHKPLVFADIDLRRLVLQRHSLQPVRQLALSKRRLFVLGYSILERHHVCRLSAIWPTVLQSNSLQPIRCQSSLHGSSSRHFSNCLLL